jgi:DegV family protein with EDD domain
MVMRAVAWAEAGDSVKTITGRLDQLVKRQRLYILLDTLDFLRRGGRIGGATHLLGNLLQLKPLLALSDGKIEALSKERTKQRALTSLKERVLRECAPGEEGQLCVMHAGVEGEARELAEYFKQKLGLSEVPIYFAQPAIMVHAGPGALAVGFFAKEDND